ncbi:MAG: LD-carboxypeptidase [Holosporaceae bacterium]|nr:LD-carboxypeptidase [Holosporaceae bacterium]
MIRLLLFFLCIGCSENHREKVDLSSKSDDKNFKEVCRKIRNLDVIAIAPGSGVSLSFADFLKRSGINVPATSLINNDVFGSADTDDHRLNYLLDAINSDHKIIWALRGGFGTARLLAALDRLPSPRTAKTLVGFSDVTSLNLFISQKWPHWRVIHATVLAYLDEKSYQNKFGVLLDILNNKIDHYSIDNISPLNEKAKISKNVTGKLTGGNLTIIENSLKTCWEIQTEGKIIFIEDVHEEAEHIYRMMCHLREVGKLSKVKALVFGHFHATSDRKKVLLYLKGFAQTLDIPVYITDQFGHGDYNMPLIYNAVAEIHEKKMIVNIS